MTAAFRRLSRSSSAPLLAAGLLASALAGCGASADAADGHAEHSSGAVASISTAAGQDRYAGVDLPDPYPRPNFSLTDTAGAPYDLGARTAGKPTLLFFGYTRCPDVCPTTLADIAVALRNVDPALAKRVQVVFVTTDPAYDTPQVLGEYLDRFDGDLPTRFVGLTGSQQQVEQAQQAAGVPVAQDDGKMHSALLLLYGGDDEAHVAFDAGNGPKDIAHDLKLMAAGS